MPGEMTIDVRELARRLSCGRSAAYALAASGALRTVRVGRALRIPESAVVAKSVCDEAAAWPCTSCVHEEGVR
jgi:excisionase family DNA binding protein